MMFVDGSSNDIRPRSRNIAPIERHANGKIIICGVQLQISSLIQVQITFWQVVQLQSRTTACAKGTIYTASEQAHIRIDCGRQSDLDIDAKRHWQRRCRELGASTVILSHPAPCTMQVDWCSSRLITVRTRTLSGALYKMVLQIPFITYLRLERVNLRSLQVVAAIWSGSVSRASRRTILPSV
jgi:hypothetical protein